MSVEHQCSQRTIRRGLKRIGKNYRAARQVPKVLTTDQMQNRVNICEQLLTNPLDERFFKRIITCDEKWVLFFNPNKKRQWLSPGQLGLATPKKDFHQKKVMLCVWWNFSGIIHFELLESPMRINADLYTRMLNRVQVALLEQYPALVNRSQVLYLHDNAKPHTAEKTQKKIKQLGWEVLAHPPYSPDISPSDFHLFKSMEHFLRGKQFTELEEVKAALQEYFASKNESFFKKGIQSLAEKWQLIIEHKGAYFK